MSTITKRTIAAAMALATAAAPATAYAMQDPGPGGPAPEVITVTARPSVARAPQGFRWDDAGIGAAATIGLLGAAGAGAVLLRRRPEQQTSAS